MMLLRTFLFVGILAMASSCRAKSPHPGKSIGIERHAGVKDLYQFAESHRKQHGLPALGVGIVRDGRIIGLGMAGERESGSGDWATLDDRFDVGSCSKAVTATVAAMRADCLAGPARSSLTLPNMAILPLALPAVFSIAPSLTCSDLWIFTFKAPMETASC
jgi:hypothetical protein